jgi:transposase
MAKHETKFKLEVIRDYRRGKQGVQAIARHYGLDHGTVRRWVERYGEHGISGLQKKYSHFSVSFKKSVLKRMWRDQLSHRQVSVLFDLREPGAVSRWERQYHAGTLTESRRGLKTMPSNESPKPVDAKDDDALSREELLKQVKYLRAEVAYLKKMKALIQAKKEAAQ